MSIFSFGQRPAARLSKDANASAAARDQWLRASFEAAPIGLATATLDGRWLNVNETCCHLLGYTRAEIVHYSLNDLTHPEDAAKELTLIRRVIAGDQRQYRIEKRIIDKGGHYRTLLVSATLIRGTGAKADPDVFVYVIEQTEKQAESGHDAGRLAINILEELSDIAVIRSDARGMVTGWNKGAERIFGYTRQEILGKNRRLFYRDQDNWDDRPLVHLRSAYEQGRYECDDFRVARGGAHVWLHCSVTPYAPDGTVRGYIEVLSPRNESESLVDLKPMIDTLRGERDEARAANELAQHENEELRRFGETRDQELRILADALRVEIERRNEAEQALSALHDVKPLPPIEEPRPSAPPTLELNTEPAWTALAGTKSIDLLIDAAANQRTGSLIVANGASHKALFFEGGRLTCIASDDPADFLGERLVRSGVITESQRTKALQLARTTDLAFARCLVILGMMSDDMVREALRGKIEDDVEVMASWTDCSWSFVDRQPPHRKLLQLSLDVYDLRAVKEAIGSHAVRALREVESDVEVESFHYVSTKSGTRFHKTSCKSLRRAAEDQLVQIKNKSDAKSRGLEPCGNCLK